MLGRDGQGHLTGQSPPVTGYVASSSALHHRSVSFAVVYRKFHEGIRCFLAQADTPSWVVRRNEGWVQI